MPHCHGLYSVGGGEGGGRGRGLVGVEPQVGLYSELERLSRNFCFLFCYALEESLIID